MTSCYVKYGFGWTMLQEQNHVYLSNSLTLKLFQIDIAYQNMAKEITAGADIDELAKRYGDDWYTFKKQLEDNKAVYYSKNKTILIDRFDYGAKMALLSNYVVQIPPISQLNIQINEKCTLNCVNCSQITMYECMSCHASKKTSRHIDVDLADSAIEFLSLFGIRLLVIQGGDPFLDYDLLIHLVRKFKSNAQNGDVLILTNSSIFATLGEDKIKEIKDLDCEILITIVEDNDAPWSSLKNLVSEYGIRHHIQTRDCSVSRPGILSNDTVIYTRNKGRALVEPEKIIRSTSLYGNTILSLFNNCYYGKIFISVDGSIGTCKHNLLDFNLTTNNWNEVLPKINKLWKTNSAIKCSGCGLRQICFSCDALQQNQHLNNGVKTCFLQV